MKTLEQQLRELEGKISKKISSLISKRGVQSRFSTTKVLKIENEDLQLKVDRDGSFIVEITQDELIDQAGYRYTFEWVTLEHLCKIVDSL